jgi:hypothetical protein
LRRRETKVRRGKGAAAGRADHAIVMTGLAAWLHDECVTSQACRLAHPLAANFLRRRRDRRLLPCVLFPAHPARVKVTDNPDTVNAQEH